MYNILPINIKNLSIIEVKTKIKKKILLILSPYKLHSMVRRAIADWMERKHIERWKSPRPSWKDLNKERLLNC